MTTKIKTEFGTATLGVDNYYRVSTPNGIRLLHRLIYEDYHKVCLLDGIVLHHIDGNKLNNEIDNLMPMFNEDHSSLHMQGDAHPFYGKHHSDEAKRKISEANKGFKHSHELKLKNSILTNTVGYFRVSKNLNKKAKQGFYWVYQYYDENGKHRKISSVDLEKLKQKVLARGLEWRCIN